MVGSIAWGGCDPAVTSPGGECISGSHSQSVVFHRRRAPGFQWVYTSLCPSRVFDKSSCRGQLSCQRGSSTGAELSVGRS